MSTADGLRGSIPLLVPNRLNIEYLCDKAALMRSPLKTWLVLFSHKDTISNGRCVVIGEIYGTNNVKRASKEIVDATTQMSSQQVVMVRK